MRRDEEIDRRAHEGEQRPGVAREGQRQQHARGCLVDLHRDDNANGHERGDRAVDADQRRESGREEHHPGNRGGRLLSGAFDDDLADPGGHPGGVEGLTHHEQRGDVDDDRVAESCQRLLEGERAGQIESDRDSQRHDPRGYAVAHERDDRHQQDDGDGESRSHGRQYGNRGATGMDDSIPVALGL